MKNWNAKGSEVYDLQTGRTIARTDIGGKDKETEANAKLIAAAPKLLMALKAVTDQLNVYLDADDSVTEEDLTPSVVAAEVILDAETI